MVTLEQSDVDDIAAALGAAWGAMDGREWLTLVRAVSGALYSRRSGRHADRKAFEMQAGVPEWRTTFEREEYEGEDS